MSDKNGKAISTQSDIIEMENSIFISCVSFRIILSFCLCFNLCKIFAFRIRPMQLLRCLRLTMEHMVSYRSRACVCVSVGRRRYAS